MCIQDPASTTSSILPYNDCTMLYSPKGRLTSCWYPLLTFVKRADWLFLFSLEQTAEPTISRSLMTLFRYVNNAYMTFFVLTFPNEYLKIFSKVCSAISLGPHFLIVVNLGKTTISGW